jgi:hypothetical protein
MVSGPTGAEGEVEMNSNAKSTSARPRSKTFGFPSRAMERIS